MRNLSVTAVAFALATIPAFAFAQSSGTPWEIVAVTSTAADTLEESRPYRVEHRRLQKVERLFLRAGFSYLERADYYRNPGISAEISWYLTEEFAIDVFSGTLFFSQLSQTAARLLEDTGLEPDSQKPRARLTAGPRLSIAYGKFLVESLGTVVHVDFGAALHLGVLWTDETFNPAADLSLSFQVLAYDRVFVWLDGGWLGSFESRTTNTFASGLLATIGLGLVL